MITEEHVGMLKGILRNTSGWLKFLGIVNIVMGGLAAITIVGIVFAWLPIWMGILLYKSGANATEFVYSDNANYLIESMDKLRTFFVLQGILVLIQVAFIIFMFLGILPFSWHWWHRGGMPIQSLFLNFLS